MRRAHKIVACYVGFLVGVMLAGFCVNGQTGEQISWETGLDQDLFATMQIELQGREVAVFFVYLNDRAFDSNISPGLAEKLQPFANRNALYVNVTVQRASDQIDLDPTRFTILQAGHEPSIAVRDSWAEITPGFLDGLLQLNPEDPSYGSGSIGVLLLGEVIDPERLFTISYDGQEERAITLMLDPRAAAAPGPGLGWAGSGEAATDPMHEDPRQGSVANTQVAIPFLDALLDGDVQTEELAGLLGIEPRRIHLIECGGETDQLRIMLIELDNALFLGRVSADGMEDAAGPLWEIVSPLAGTGAVMVWAASTTGAEFTPYAFYLQQAGSTFLFFSRSSFVDLTEGFTARRRLAPGEVSAGIVLLHRGIDLQRPFTMHYCGGMSQFGDEAGDANPNP